MPDPLHQTTGWNPPPDCACKAHLDNRLCPACTTWPYVCAHDPGIAGKGPLTLRDKLAAREARRVKT